MSQRDGGSVEDLPAGNSPHRGLRIMSQLLVLLSAVVILSDILRLILGLDLTVVTHFMYIALPLALLGYVWFRFGRSFAALSSSLLFFGGIAVEVLGTRTGLPFGSYSYTAAFQPQVFGIPLEIALGWLTLGLMSYSLATQGGLARPWAALLASSLMVAWDVLYDPVFVGLGMWVWREGTYFSVPISNFVGWFIVSLVFFVIISAARGPRNLPVEGISAFAPLTVYLSYVVDGCVSNIFLGQALAGLVGGTLMVVIALVAYAARLRSIGARAQRNRVPSLGSLAFDGSNDSGDHALET